MVVRKKIFEDVVLELDDILKSKRSFWNLEAVSHIDYDDISQIIRLHIHAKFNQWDQKDPFKPWASKIVNNQISNLKEKHYGRFAPPCRTCEHDLGENRCAFTSCGVKTEECPELSKWQKSKESAYRMLLAESSDKAYVDDPEGESRIKIQSAPDLDYFKASDKLHVLMLKGLNEKSQKMYRLLFIESRSDDYISKEMGYKTSEEGMKPGYRQISSMKKMLIARAKKIMKENDVFSD